MWATKASGTRWGDPLRVSPAPTVEELLAQLERQPLLLKGARSLQPLLLKKR
jgi:hypothetical protein